MNVCVLVGVIEMLSKTENEMHETLMMKGYNDENKKNNGRKIG